jgi:flagellar motor switch protein FliM
VTPAPKPITLIRTAEDRNSWPGLERIAALLATKMGTLLDGYSAEIAASEVKALDVVGAQIGETHISARYRMVPLKGSILLSLPIALIQSLVERQFGGNGETNFARHHLHTSECRFFERLAGNIAEALADSWQDFARIEPSIAHIDPACAPPALGGPDQKIAVQTIALRSPHGTIWPCYLLTPLSLIHALPQLAEAAVEDDEQAEADPVWHTAFANAVMQVRLPVRTIFARPELPLRELLTLKSGDIIPLCLSDTLPVTVGGMRFAEAKIGESNGRAAICIEAPNPESIYDE